MNPLDEAMLALLRAVSAAAIMPRYRNLAAGDVEDKAAPGGKADPVTIADLEAEARLREGLAAIDPALAFVGEEAAHAEPAVLDALAGDCWIVDPIDGTRNFAAGQPPFGIIIARARGGLAEEGWLYDCLSGRLCSARRGGGAFVDGERIAAKSTGATRPVAAISQIFLDNAQREAMKIRIAPHYHLVDIPYCAAEQYPRLGLGINDLSLFERTLPWDHAAGVLWLEEAGGKAARPDGTAYRVDEWAQKGLIGAASPRLWEQAAKRLAVI